MLMSAILIVDYPSILHARYTPSRKDRQMLINATFAVNMFAVTVSCENGREFGIKITRYDSTSQTFRTSPTFKMNKPRFRAFVKLLQSADKKTLMSSHDGSDISLTANYHGIAIRFGDGRWIVESKDEIKGMAICLEQMIIPSTRERLAK